MSPEETCRPVSATPHVTRGRTDVVNGENTNRRYGDDNATSTASRGGDMMGDTTHSSGDVPAAQEGATKYRHTKTKRKGVMFNVAEYQHQNIEVEHPGPDDGLHASSCRSRKATPFKKFRNIPSSP